MSKNKFSELPDESITVFNSNYETARLLSKKGAKVENFDRSLEEVVQDMAGQIGRVCYFAIEGSLKKEKIFEELIQVFKSNKKMELDSWSVINVIVNPPNKSSNVIDYNISSTSKFQFGNLILEVEGNPKLQTQNGDKSVLARLTYLYKVVTSQ